MPDKQHTYGQFETPSDVSDLLLGFCLREQNDRILDPSCGRGAILKRAAQMHRWRYTGETTMPGLWGVELDTKSAVLAQEEVPEAHIIESNFFELSPWADWRFDAIVGNPPYTRAEWISLIEQKSEFLNVIGRQLAIFEEGNHKPSAREGQTQDHFTLGKRSGLHAYFFIHGTQFLREGGRFGFVVPNSWLDVAYGEKLKQFLLEHYRIIALIESNVERWFSQAKINTCLVILEKCSDAEKRATNKVKMVCIRRPLRELIPADEGDRKRLRYLEMIIDPVLNKDALEGEAICVRSVMQHGLVPAEKWGYKLRAPEVLLARRQAADLHPLASWASIRRGFTTGANAFFYLDQETVAEWEIEPAYRKPMMKSLRGINRRMALAEDCELELFFVGPNERLEGTAAGEYIRWGESQDIHRRRTCRSRHPWYTLGEQATAPILMAKGIWERHFAPIVAGEMVVDQQLYLVYLADGVPVKAAAALLNSAWFELQLELQGRVNFGEGVLWMAAYEFDNLLLPDPRYLPPVQLDELTSAFESLLDRPVGSVFDEARQTDWQALNAVIFDILDISPMDGVSVTESLLERMTVRKTKAGAP